MEIHIRRNGKRMGPYSLEEVREVLTRNELTLADEAWHRGLHGWTPLESVVQPLEGDGRASAQTTVNKLVAALTSLARTKRRMGCCGWMIVAVLFATVVMGFEYLTEEKTESVSNGVATIKVYARNPRGEFAADALAAQVAEQVWETANAHPDVRTVTVNIFGELPERTHTDRYGNQTTKPVHFARFDELKIENLDQVRRYRTKEAFAGDAGVGDEYRNKLITDFRAFLDLYNNED